MQSVLKLSAFIVFMCLKCSARRRTSVHFQAVNKNENGAAAVINGLPGIDYPIYHHVPRTGFTCASRLSGYYADIESGCQAFHFCFREVKTSFLCHNGTIFNQKLFTCDWWFNVDCKHSNRYFSVNKQLYKVSKSKVNQVIIEMQKYIESAKAAEAKRETTTRETERMEYDENDDEEAEEESDAEMTTKSTKPESVKLKFNESKRKQSSFGMKLLRSFS
ncbi:uncharacterized protein B4U80_10333 [Leptotrombidium deliense]|uniref:Chitin-binding type-2 domain-containing protein n=1 Tax=Leptotrombidium deliense TaxID=299467 RepID=A0A443SW49_9ACAR|nr:uncharacterized protein B4U80_10333 [Leptotrombidium deliense]